MLVDTSAWVEFLRATGSSYDGAVQTAVQQGEVIVVLDVVRLELLAGAGPEDRAHDLRLLLARFEARSTRSPADHERAAELYRSARRAGQAVRSLLDCLVAAAALRLDVPVLARDRDFQVLAAVSDLRLA